MGCFVCSLDARSTVLYTPLVHRIKWTNYNLDWSYLAWQKVTGNSHRVYKWNEDQFLTFKKSKKLIFDFRSPIGTLVCVKGGPCSCWWSPGIVVTALCIVAFIVVARVLNIINVSLVVPHVKGRDTAANVSQEWQSNFIWGHSKPKKLATYLPDKSLGFGNGCQFGELPQGYCTSF